MVLCSIVPSEPGALGVCLCGLHIPTIVAELCLLIFQSAAMAHISSSWQDLVPVLSVGQSGAAMGLQAMSAVREMPALNPFAEAVVAPTSRVLTLPCSLRGFCWWAGPAVRPDASL